MAQRRPVKIQLPMKLRTEPLPGTTNIVALLDGPIVLAGDLGTNGMPATTRSSDASRFVRTPAPTVPVLVANSLKSLLGQGSSDETAAGFPRQKISASRTT